MIEEVKMFKTGDSKTFATIKLAEDHERMIEFKKWYEEGGRALNVEYDGYFEHIDAKDLFSWLLKNKTQILRTYGLKS